MTAKERKEAENQWIKWEREMNETLGESHSQYRVVYLPPEDLMPYNHIRICTQMENRVMELKETQEETEDTVILPMEDEEETETIEMALMVYKAALMAIHGEKIRAEIKKANDAKGEGRS